MDDDTRDEHDALRGGRVRVTGTALWAIVRIDGAPARLECQ
jgi:hypothetical protein